MSIDKVRDSAIDVLLRVFERNVRLDDSLDRTLRRRPQSDRGRRFMTQLVYGTVRHKALCDHILAGCVHQSMDKLPKPILAVLRMGVFQALFCNQVPFPAMVHTSVDLAKKRGHAGTARLTNAVLKRVPEDLETAVSIDPKTDPIRYAAVRYSIPEWLAERWHEERGAEGLLTLSAALNEQAPRSIRANTLRTTPQHLERTLEKAGFTAKSQTPVPDELTLAAGMPIRSKSFLHGEFIFQDPASMVAAHLLDPQPGERILDICAAPGGKTTHLAALSEDKATIVAADQEPRRMNRLIENVERLGTESVHLVCSDALHPPFRAGFDRVLVDAPCSGLGTIRRHPDLKWRLKAADIPRLAENQQTILRAAADLCENGGVVVYSVCTFTPEETRSVVKGALPPDQFEEEDGPAWLEPWRVSRGTYQTDPAAHSLDGFFLMRLRKRSS